MLRYASSFALSFVIAVAAVATVNHGVDAVGIYRARAEIDALANAYAERLIGSQVGLVAVGPERSIKIALARRSTADCAVIGASYVMELDADSGSQMFGDCKNVVNLAVLGGGFEDFVALMGARLSRGGAGTVYLGVAPWMLRRHVNRRFAEERAAYDQGRLALGLSEEPNNTDEKLAWYANLVSADYLRHNIAFATRAMQRNRHRMLRDFEIRDARSAGDEESVIAPSGAIHYPRNMLARAPLAESMVNLGSSVASPGIDPAVLQELENVLTVLVKRGVAVKFVLMPVHPALMRCSDARACGTFKNVEGHIRDLGRRLGLEVIGSYDPRPFALTGSDFIDSHHLRKEALPRVRPLNFDPWSPHGG